MQISNTTKYQYVYIPNWALDESPGTPFGEKHRPGYVLIADHLVSMLFLEKILAELEHSRCLYGSAIHARDFFDNPDFWKTLSPRERDLVGPCLLFLIDNGNLGNS